VKAIIVADGDLHPPLGRRARATTDGDSPVLVIAADGGAEKARRVGLRPDVVVGDADSLSAPALASLAADGVELRLLPAEKDESDTEAALRVAIARGADSIVVLGALGGSRFEHALANVALLALPELDRRQVAMGDGRTWVSLVGSTDGPGSVELEGEPGDYVSLLPLDTEVGDVRTDGLRYPLTGEPLQLGSSRGLSNELLGRAARVTTGRGRLLIVETPRGVTSRPMPDAVTADTGAADHG
jgi:thiamine pyrophosphokinase